MTNTTTLRRSAIAFALTMLVVLIALASNVMPAQAQTAVTLVSNYESKHATQRIFVGDLNDTTNDVIAQSFETGGNSTGYTLNSVKFEVLTTDGADVSGKVTIYSADSDGDPDAELHELTGTITTTGEKTFTAPADTVLAASTTYFIHLEDESLTDNEHGMGLARVNDTDTDSALTGWSLEQTLSQEQKSHEP